MIVFSSPVAAKSWPKGELELRRVLIQTPWWNITLIDCGGCPLRGPLGPDEVGPHAGDPAVHGGLLGAGDRPVGDPVLTRGHVDRADVVGDPLDPAAEALGRAVEGLRRRRSHKHGACKHHRSRCTPNPSRHEEQPTTTPSYVSRIDVEFLGGVWTMRRIGCHAPPRSGRRVSNPRPRAWEARALPAELRPRPLDSTRGEGSGPPLYLRCGAWARNRSSP